MKRGRVSELAFASWRPSDTDHARNGGRCQNLKLFDRLRIVSVLHPSDYLTLKNKY